LNRISRLNRELASLGHLIDITASTLDRNAGKSTLQKLGEAFIPTPKDKVEELRGTITRSLDLLSVQREFIYDTYYTVIVDVQSFQAEMVALGDAVQAGVVSQPVAFESMSDAQKRVLQQTSPELFNYLAALPTSEEIKGGTIAGSADGTNTVGGSGTGSGAGDQPEPPPEIAKTTSVGTYKGKPVYDRADVSADGRVIGEPGFSMSMDSTGQVVQFNEVSNQAGERPGINLPSISLAAIAGGGADEIIGQFEGPIKDYFDGLKAELTPDPNASKFSQRLQSAQQLGKLEQGGGWVDLGTGTRVRVDSNGNLRFDRTDKDWIGGVNADILADISPIRGQPGVGITVLEPGVAPPSINERKNELFAVYNESGFLTKLPTLQSLEWDYNWAKNVLDAFGLRSGNPWIIDPITKERSFDEKIARWTIQDAIDAIDNANKQNLGGNEIVNLFTSRQSS